MKLNVDTPDPNDPEVELFFRRIPNGMVVRRVVVNTRVAPWRVVNVFFNRGMSRVL